MSRKLRSKNTSRKAKYKFQAIRFNLLLLVIVISLTAPFWHKFFSKTSTESVLGFRNVRVLLYSFGSPYSSFSVSVFLMWLSFSVSEFRKIIRLVSVVLMFTSLYSLFWVFAPITDYPKTVYETVICFMSLVSILISYLIIKKTKNLTEIIRNLFSFIYDNQKNVIPEKQNEYAIKKAGLTDEFVGNE